MRYSIFNPGELIKASVSFNPLSLMASFLLRSLPTSHPSVFGAKGIKVCGCSHIALVGCWRRRRKVITVIFSSLFMTLISTGVASAINNHCIYIEGTSLSWWQFYGSTGESERFQKATTTAAVQDPATSLGAAVMTPLSSSTARDGNRGRNGRWDERARDLH